MVSAVCSDDRTGVCPDRASTGGTPSRMAAMDGRAAEERATQCGYKEPVVFDCTNCAGCRTKKCEPTAVREKFFGWNVKIHGLKALSGG